MATAKQLITDHMDLWTAAIKRKSTAGRGSSSKVELYGIKKLRELILELAVRGLLVPQDANDEPASELLKKITAAKAKLVKEGKINEEKLLAPISDDDKAFDIPDSWEWSRLQDVSEYIQRGKGPIYAESGRVRVVSQKCIQRQGFDIAASRFVDDASLSGYKEERFLKSQDLLWNSTGTGTVGRVNVLEQVPEQTLVADSHVTVVRTLDVKAKYFCIYICSPGVQSRIEPTHEASLVSGSTQQVELNTSAVILLPVPVPPLDEQCRIVAKVDDLMMLCDQLEQQSDSSLSAHQTLVETFLSALTSSADQAQFANSWQRVAEHLDTLLTTEDSIERLRQTILQLAVMGKLVPQDPNDEPASELLKKIAAEKAKLVKEGKIKKERTSSPFGDIDKPYDLPPTWSWVRFGEIAYQITDGAHHTPAYINAGVPFLSVKDMSTGRLDFSDTRYISIEQHTDLAKRCNPKKGDLLFTKIGTTGIPVLVETDREFSIFVSVALIKFPQKLVCGSYLVELIKSRLVKKQSEDGTEGVGNKNLVLRKIAGFVLAIPPLSEQHRIVAKVDELMALCDLLQSRLSDAQKTQLQLADAMAGQALAEAW